MIAPAILLGTGAVLYRVHELLGFAWFVFLLLAIHEIENAASDDG